METFVAIILVLIMIIYDSNFIEHFKKRETFVVSKPNISNIQNLLPKENPLLINTTPIWIFVPNNDLNNITDIERLCISTVHKHMSKYNIKIINYNKIKILLPEYLDEIDNCKTLYLLHNLIKYAILHKYGGLWLPSSSIIMKPLNILNSLRRDKLITFGNNNTQLINNSGKSDIILCCNKDNLIISNMLTFIKKNINSFQNSINFSKGINAHFNKIVNDHNHHHTNQIQEKINNSPINNSHLFSNQLSIDSIDCNIVHVNFANIINNTKYSFLINMSQNDILNSNMLIGRLLNKSMNS